MILSSADILRILSGDAIIREEARVAVVEGRPGLGVEDVVYIYIDKYPVVDEFEATWKIWVQDNSGMGSYVLNAMTALLPGFEFNGKHYTTTDFASERTVVKTQEEIDREEFKERFSGLQKGLEDRLGTVRNGIDGKDGKDGIDGLPGRDGKDGRDGRDGRDINATDTELFELKDVEQGIKMERGQVLTWDGSKWTNLYVRQSLSAGGSAVSTGGDTGGDTGVSSTIGWTYHPHDHTQEPNSGHFHTDNSDGELVTVFHVSNETSRGNDVEVLLRDLLVQGYDRIYVALGEDLSQAHLYSITGYTETASGFEINVTHVETAGLEPDYQNAKLYEFLFTRSAPAAGSVDNVTIISETTPVTRTNGDALIEGDSWYVQSTDQLYLYIAGVWEEIKVVDGAGGGAASGLWKFKDLEAEGYDDGKFRVNSHQGKTDWSLTTELYIAYKTNDGADVKNILLNLVKPDQYVYIQRRDRTDAWVVLQIEAEPIDADPKGCRIAVSFVSQGTAVSDFTNDKLCSVSFMVVSNSGGGGIPEAPQDGNYYVRQNATWQPTTTASISYNLSQNQLSDLGDTAISGAQPGEALIWNGAAWANGGDFAGGSF